MIGEGYDPSVINMLAAAGATDAQLQGLWNNYEPNDPDFFIAANDLVRLLKGQGPSVSHPSPTPQASSPSTPPAAAPRPAPPVLPPQLNLPMVPYYVQPSPPLFVSWWDQPSLPRDPE
jgi:hypothetical protein